MTESPDFVGEPPKGAPTEDPMGHPSIDATITNSKPPNSNQSRHVIRRTDYKRPDHWLPEDWAPVPAASKEAIYEDWKSKDADTKKKTELTIASSKWA